jgi:hypothetical protein
MIPINSKKTTCCAGCSTRRIFLTNRSKSRVLNLSPKRPNRPVPFRMYIDECGTDDIVSCHLPEHQHLALTGVILDLDVVRDIATPRMIDLKNKHFPEEDPDGDPIVLHRSDFLAHKGRFHTLSDEARMSAFIADLEQYLFDLEHTVITVVLDKDAMMKRAHWRNKEPYHYCAEVLAEKFVQFLERRKAVGDIWAESRKSAKNKRLQRAFEGVCKTGSRFVDPARYGANFSTFDITFREKKHNNTGIQIADAYAKPSMDRIMLQKNKHLVRSPFSKRLGALLYVHKYDRAANGEQWGYGMKYL